MTIVLEKGKHALPEEGMCLLEAVAFIAGEDFTDAPKCASPVLAEFGRTLNDLLPDDARQQLIPLIPKLIGTVNPEQDQQDGLRCAHWLVAHWLPAWLDLVPELKSHATALRAIPAPKSWSDAGKWASVVADAWTAAITFRGGSWKEGPHILEGVSSHSVIMNAVGAARDASKSMAFAEVAVAVALEARHVAIVSLAVVPKERRGDVPHRVTQDTIDLFTELIEGRHK
jgi:hypothetical protein